MQSAYQGYDVRWYEDELERAITRYGLPQGAPRSSLRDLDYRVADLLGYMQPSAALYWQFYLYHALVAGDVFDRSDIWTITVLDKRWHFGEHRWNFAPTKIEYQVRRALHGLNYLMMIEFEVFGNLHHLEQLSSLSAAPEIDPSLPPHLGWRMSEPRQRDDGRIIAPHLQGLIWGQRPSRRQRSQFPGSIFNASGIKLMPLTDFAGAVRYMVKPPYMGRLVRMRSKGGHVRYPWTAMPLLLHHLLFCNLHRYCFADLTFASGEGRAILAHANRLWRDYNLVGLRRHVYPQQPFHQIRLRRNSD